MNKIPEDIQGLGYVFRWLRTEARMTVNAVSRQVGISAETWSAIEHDREEPSDTVFEKVSSLFEVSEEDLRRRVGTVSKEAAAFWDNNPELRKLVTDLNRDRRCRCPHCIVVR